MCKKTQNFQISSKFHRLNRRKAGIFSCMRSARVDWGKSHRQIVKFSRGLRFRAKICIFSTRNHAKIILFDFFRTFRVMAPAATPQKYKNNTKYASDRGPFTVRHNYATLRGPKHLCGASACCGAGDCTRVRTNFGPNFFEIRQSEIAQDCTEISSAW